VGFWIKLRQEERLLVRNFPEEYPAYRARVRALVPYVL
jgi:protein-S-isoprenylcysteine O-methyltransferase Ste14